MTVDKVKLKARAEQLMADHVGGLYDPIPAIPVTAPDVLALLAEIDQLKADRDYCKRIAVHNKEIGDQFKAENEQLRKDAERFRHLMFNHVDWARNGKDDDAVMLEFGPYPSHKLRETLDADMAKIIGDSQETISHA